jgi:hypothetical protein
VLTGLEPAPFLDLLDELVKRHPAILQPRACGAADISGDPGRTTSMRRRVQPT